MPVIALITDLREKDYFIGAMKGKILSINPQANIVDITHQIPRHDTRTAAFVLTKASETFPKGSIFIAVIDPGVGTKRRCILLRTKNGLNFIGPDNGIFTLVGENFEIEEIREVSNKELMEKETSETFHGRDIMAPVGAYLSKGVKIEKVGPKIDEIETLDFGETIKSGSKIQGDIIHIDSFGNIITNIEKEEIEEITQVGETLKLEVGDYKFKISFVETFGEVPIGEKLCYIGSSGKLEMAKNQGNLAEEIKTKTGSKIIVEAE